MNTIGDLQHRIDEIDRVLGLKSLSPYVTPDAEASLKSKILRLRARLDELPETILTVGIMGGTGVGKSTVMNALAGSLISSTSHRRPHTDAIIVYRNEETPMPPSFSVPDLPWREESHRADSIRSLVLCDFPDFDSIAGDHARMVLRFMDNIDVILWVTSLEKYADSRFYSFLSQAAKNPGNFYFAVNKIDQIFHKKRSDDAFSILSDVDRDFRRHLKGEAGILDPTVFYISAKDDFESDSPAFWNHCASLRREVFHHRDLKSLREIKASNLDHEITRLNEEIREKVTGLTAAHEALTNSLRQWEKRWENKDDTPFMARQDFITRFAPLFHSYVQQPSLLVGPGYGVYVLFHEILRKSVTSPSTHGEMVESMTSFLTGAITGGLQTMNDDIANNLLRAGAPAAVSKNIAGTDENRTDGGENDRIVTGIINEHLSMSNRSFNDVFFYCGQYLAYGIITLMVLLSLAGWSNVISWWKTPDLSGLLDITIAFFNTLFSGRGLAALVTYAIMSLFVGFRSYRRYEKMMRRTARKRTHHLVDTCRDYLFHEYAQRLKALQNVNDELGTAVSLLTEKKNDDRRKDV